MAVSRDIVDKYIDSALKSEVLEDSFRGFVLPSENGESKTKDANCPGMKRIMLTISTNSEPDKIIKHYVNSMAQVKSPSKFDVLFEMLRLLVQQHPNLGKAICEAFLSCDKLDYHNQHSWMKSFALICDILPHVDYKGVRDILKHVLEIIYSLPEKFDIAIIPQLDTLYATFSMILDREACLLPAYLSLDELQKKITQGNAPVWKFAELFYHFIESFRPTAQIFSIINRPDLLPVVGCSSCHSNPTWRLDPISAKFQLKGLLPYKDKLKEPQVGQVRYLLEQCYSKEMICNILSLSLKPSQHQRCSELIEQIAITLVNAMDKSEQDIEQYEHQSALASEHLFNWIHLSNNTFHYIVFSHATISFNQLVDSLCEKLKERNHKRGKEFLMWSMLQYITGSTKTSLADFKAIIKLFDLLYPGRVPIPVPRDDQYLASHVLAAASIWLQLIKRAEIDQVKFYNPLPPSLQLHYDYITNTKQNEEIITRAKHIDVVHLNAHGTSRSAYTVNNFVDCLCRVDPIHNPDPMQVEPLPVKLLDTLTTHSKIALLHTIAQRIINIAQYGQQKMQPNPAKDSLVTPALVQTFGRLLMYADSEQFGIKTFINHVVTGPSAVWRFQGSWPIYHILLEMYNYRLHHVSMNYKFSMLFHLHNLSPMVYGANLMQLSMAIEATELKLLLGLSNIEAMSIPMTGRAPGDAKTIKHVINNDSEEINKVLVLVLARSTNISSNEHLTASFLDDILDDINKVTPLSWCSSVSSFFPEIIKNYFIKNNVVKDTDKNQLRQAVEEEFRKWKAMGTEMSTLVAHFSQPNAPPLFFCVLWKVILEQEQLDPVVYRILDNIRVRTLVAHLRTFIDYLIMEYANLKDATVVNKFCKALEGLIWKYQIIPLDRLILCLSLKNLDGPGSQLCLFIIQQILIKSHEFKNMVREFCKIQSPEHYKEGINCHKINNEFLKAFPEKYYHDFLLENNMPSKDQTLPTYFGNICLRFLPVLDILIHRTIEWRILHEGASLRVDRLVEEYGCLYKYHDKPLTYLYNTLHYYDPKLPVSVRRLLSTTIINAFQDLRPQNWCFSPMFSQYLQESPKNGTLDNWVPNQEYYRNVMGRLVETLQGKNLFYHTDWRFNEFFNVKSHAVHATAIELMTLPVDSTNVGNALLDLVLTSHADLDRSLMSQWMNAIGLVMTALPASYNNVLHTKILEYMKSPLLTNPAYTRDILHLMNFCECHDWMPESQISHLVALTHAIWHHSCTGQIFSVCQKFWQTQLKPVVQTESQFLFVCCLIGPFLPRLERSRVMMDVVVELYEMLGKVDASSEIQHLNTICDFFYHIKYMFTGDAVKNDIERCIRNFKPKLQYCLRFITHLNISSEQHPKMSD